MELKMLDVFRRFALLLMSSVD